MKFLDTIQTLACFMVLSVAIASTDASAQSSAALGRREALAKVQELINDPDPLMRLANFEALAEEGDATKVQIAIQTALTGNDPMLRAAAMKAYLAGGREFVATLSLDPAIQQKLTKAMLEGQTAVGELGRVYAQLDEFVNYTALRGSFNITEFNSKSSKGIMSINWGREGNRGSSVQVSGDRLVGKFGIANTTNEAACPFEARPTRELMLVGTFSCAGTGFGVVKMIAPMF